MDQPKLRRRDFIKTVGIGAATIISLQVVGKASGSGAEKESSPHKWAMVIDQAKCTGCGYCTLACRAHNDVPPSISWNRVIPAGKIGAQEVFVARPCMHCEHAPCVEVCPVGASYHRGDGIVMMDYAKCIGCRYCVMACPYGARAFNWEEFTGPNPEVPEWGEPEIERRPRGVVEKCSFCYQRIDRGLALGLKPGVDTDATPACVVACPVGARKFGDLNDPESEVSRLLADQASYRLREDLGTNPRVHYLPARKESAA
ncbi:MAG TPA: 4Fe-4S dicluster domain-containing protein [Anaerolineae bacterium]|nr:4Fe-4S dicluster domain-containing protein [Anaerolineae bacterium]